MYTARANCSNSLKMQTIRLQFLAKLFTSNSILLLVHQLLKLRWLQMLEVQPSLSQVGQRTAAKDQEDQEDQLAEEMEVAHLVEMVEEVQEVKKVTAGTMNMAIKMPFLIQMLVQSIIL